MKAPLTLLTGLLLLGLGSGSVKREHATTAVPVVTTERQTNPTDNELQHGPAAGEAHDAAMGDSNSPGQGHHNMLDTTHEIRQYLNKKISYLYDLLYDRKTKEEVDQALDMKPNDMPMFPDPFEINDLYKNYKLAYMNFTTIHVYGMSTLNQSELHINKAKNSFKLVLGTDRILVTGNYSLANLVKHAGGSFKVELKSVIYDESGVYYTNFPEIDIIESGADVTYQSADTDFQDIGFFTQMFKGLITRKLLEEVLPQIGREVGHLMRTTLLTQLRSNVLGVDNKEILNKMEQNVKATLSEARNFLKRGGLANVKLDGEVVDFEYKQLKGQIVDVYLSGLQSFDVPTLIVTEQNNKIRVQIGIKTSQLTGYTKLMMFYKNPTEFTVTYSVGDVEMMITFEKELYNDNSLFDIVQLQVQANQVTTMNESGARPFKTLFQEHLPKVLKQILNQRLPHLAKVVIEDVLHEAKALHERELLKKGGKV